MNLQEIQEHFSHDLFAANAGIEILEADDGSAKCKMEILPVHKNAVGGIMGGAIFTLCDLAFAVASSKLGSELSVSLTSSINFLSAAKGSCLFAEAKRIKEGRNTNCYQVSVTDDSGKLIATSVFTGFRK